MARLKNIIFDCDGVLVDSEIIANRVEAEFKTELGFPITTKEQIEKFVGLSLSDAIVQEEFKKLPANYLELVDARIKEVYKTDLKPILGIPDFLKNCTAPMCVASNSEPEWLDFKLSFTGISSFFHNAVFSSRQVKRGKPAPDLFLFAAEKMGWNVSECLVIEDSVAGVKAGLAAGMTVCGFVGGAHVFPGHAEKLLKMGAHFVVSDINSMFNQIDKNRV